MHLGPDKSAICLDSHCTAEKGWLLPVPSSLCTSDLNGTMSNTHMSPVQI